MYTCAHVAKDSLSPPDVPAAAANGEGTASGVHAHCARSFASKHAVHGTVCCKGSCAEPEQNHLNNDYHFKTFK
jgi:hypothetical protein